MYVIEETPAIPTATASLVVVVVKQVLVQIEIKQIMFKIPHFFPPPHQHQHQPKRPNGIIRG